MPDLVDYERLEIAKRQARRAGRKLNVMKEFVVHEISCVDAGACEPCKAVLIKRHQEDAMPINLHAEVAAIAKRDNITRLAAMHVLRTEQPDIVEKLRANPLPLQPAHTPVAKSDARLSFEEEVEHIMRRDGVSKLDASVRCRNENPGLWRQAYRAA